MKNKFIFVLAVFLIYSMSVTAQLPNQLSTNHTFLNKQIANSTANLLQNTAGNYNIFNESKYSTFDDSSLLNKLSANCNTPDSELAPEAAACNGVSVTDINFRNTGRTIVSGAANTPGVIFRYPNAGTAPDGTVLDTLVTVVSYNNNQDSTPANFRDADSTAPGFDGNLQPSLEPENDRFSANNARWIGNMTYRIQFVRTGTTTPVIISVAATTIDNDGSTACGGLNEAVTYSTGFNQILVSNPTTQTIAGNLVTGPQTVQAGIGTGNNYAASTLYVNVSELNWTYSFSSTGNCAQNGTSEDRFGSLNLSCQINFGRNFISVPLSGTVFNDTNGLSDSTVNGTGNNAGGLFANLLDTNGNVVSSVAVAADGTYSFPVIVSGSYNVQISTNQGIESSPAPVLALPAGWVNTGENLGAGAGNDGTVNGLLPITVAAAAITNANFGIEQRPTANNNTATSQTNPGGTTNATVPATTFTATDITPGTVSNIRITAFPSNATTITINGTQYTSGTFPGGGVTVPTNAAGNPTQPILVDPVNGAVTVGIQYVAIDNAGVESATSATASVPFATVSISGTILNDTNGLTDSTVNGTATNAGGPLYANLLDNNGVVVQTVLIPAGGTYSFAGVNSGSYTVQVSTNQGTVGNPAPVLALPTGWVSTGENIGTAAGNDGTVNGLLPVVIGTTPTNITDANFGIEQRPTANNNTTSTQTNPNGTNNATVPSTTFFATDPSGGTVSSIRITAFPSNATTITINGTQYTSGTFPGGGVIVPTNASGNPTQPILVDPFDGTVTVVIPYVAKDNAGVESATPATAQVPFAPPVSAAVVNLSGTLRLNGNPIPNALILLIDAVSGSKAIVRTDVSGNYLFDEVEIGNTYIVQPLSSKFSFNPGSQIITLFEDSDGLDFSGLPKTYHPKNDFDGDGQSDAVVFRPSEGNWYVRKSSDGEMSVYKFGLESDIPVSADFDGDGKTDYAVFRPSDGFWYIRESGNGNIRYEKFGAADDKLLPADFDGDGKADLAMYRNGIWYIVQSSNGALVIKNFGLSTDIPLTADFDGDGKTDLTVYRKSDQVWYSQPSQGNSLVATKFGLATDVPVTGDFDGEGFADIGQFRNGIWFVQNSTTGFEASQFGIAEDQSIVGDYDGDGRADTSVFRNGMWLIYRSGTRSVEQFYFGLPKDILVK